MHKNKSPVTVTYKLNSHKEETPQQSLELSSLLLLSFSEGMNQIGVHSQTRVKVWVLGGLQKQAVRVYVMRKVMLQLCS